jgi:hypothetical protein
MTGLYLGLFRVLSCWQLDTLLARKNWHEIVLSCARHSSSFDHCCLKGTLSLRSDESAFIMLRPHSLEWEDMSWSHASIVSPPHR